MTTADEHASVKGRSTLERALTWYRYVFLGFILISSADTLVRAWPENRFLTGLAGIEIVAALAFAAKPARLAAGLVMLAIFAVAFVHTIAEGGMPARFIYYAATVLFLIWFDRWMSTQAKSPASD